MTEDFDFGRLLMARLQDDGSNRGAGQDAVRLVERFHLGGLVFTTLAKFGSPNVVAGLLARAAEASDEIPFLAFEEEGGEAHPLGEFLPGLPSPGAAGRKASDIVERLGDLIGQACKLLGFNTNFAPSLDLASSPCETKSFGSDPHHVARCGQAFLRGMKAHGVLACGKHFPSLGEAWNGERRNRLPVVSRTMAQLWREDLMPYRELANQLPLVKIGVAVCKAYDFQILRPATLSAGVIEGLLRAKLQYDGVAVADISETVAVTDVTTLGEAAVQSLVAGCDLLIVEAREDLIEAAIGEIARAIDSGTLSADRIGRARRRLQSAKQSLARPSAKISSDALNKLAKEFEKFRSECGSAVRGASLA